MPRFEFSAEEVEVLLGNENAEDGDVGRLQEFFLETHGFRELNSDNRLRILVAHKGIGKSALLAMVKARRVAGGGHCVKIPPRAIVNIPVSGNAHFQTKADEWISGLRRIVARQLATDLLHIQDERLLAKIGEVSASATRPLSDSLAPSRYDPDEAHQLQLPALHRLVTSVPTYVFMDDLDLGWHASSGSKEDLDRFSSLFYALRELRNCEPLLRCRVAVRSDIFYLVSTSYPDAGKIRQYCRWFRWTNHELLAVIAKRITSYQYYRLNVRTPDVQYTDDDLLIMQNSKLGLYMTFLAEPFIDDDGPWRKRAIHTLLLTMVRKRPRDCVTLLGMAAAKMRERVNQVGNLVTPKLNRIIAADIINVLPMFSQFIFNDTRVEYRGEMPCIERLLRLMTPPNPASSDDDGFIMTTAGLLNRLRRIIPILQS